MSSSVGVSPATSAALPASGVTAKADPARLRDAACQFESLLIAQMMKTVRESSQAWLGSDGEDDQAGSTALELAEEQFAQALAHQGGLGLTSLVVSGLENKS